MNTPPEQPQGVVIHTSTGSHPADLHYIGVRADGLHVWHASTLLTPDQAFHVTAAVLPAKTLVMLPLRGDGT